MAIEYSILFPSGAPDLVTVLQRTASKHNFILTQDKDDVGYWLAGSEETFFYIISGPNLVHSKSQSLEFSFGHYSYLTNWYIRCGADSYGCLLIILNLIKDLIYNYEYDFISLVNGERVVIKHESGRSYLNQEFGAWDRKEVQEILSPLSYEIASYPVV